MLQALINSFPRVRHKGTSGSSGIMFCPPDLSGNCLVYWGRMDNKTHITNENLTSLMLVLKNGQLNG